MGPFGAPKLCALARAHPVSWDQPELRPVLEEDVARALLGVDANAIVGDDGARLGRDLELRGDRRGTRTKRESRGGEASVLVALRSVASSRRPRGARDSYLLCRVLEHGRERSLLGHAQNSVRELGVRSERYLERDLRPEGMGIGSRERGAEGRSQSFASFPARAFAAPYSHRSLSLSLSRQPRASLAPRMQSTCPPTLQIGLSTLSLSSIGPE